MNIKKDTIVRERYKGGTRIMAGKVVTFNDGYPRDREVNWFVVHGTQGGGTLEWIRNINMKTSRAKDYQSGVGLFHYLITRKGEVWEIINPDRWVHHASIGALDAGTIGVELENPDPNNAAEYMPVQYDKLVELYDKLRSEKFPKMDVILSHNRCKQKVLYEAKGLKPPVWAKKCPGPGFDWELFRKKIKAKGYEFESDPAKESLWNVR